MKPNGLGRDVGVAGAALVFAILHSLQGDPVLLYGLRALGTVVLLAVFVVRAWQLGSRLLRLQVLPRARNRPP